MLLGNGDGTFQNQSVYVTARWPRYVLSADFNDDQKMDLAVAHEKDNIYILLGDGSGAFEMQEQVTADGGAVSLAIGYFNNDNKIDLAAIIQQCKTLLVFLNEC